MTDSGKEILNKAYQKGWLSGFDFSLVIGKLLMLKLPYDWQNK